MKCTALNCKVDVDPYDVQRCCSRSDYERFCSLSTKRMLEKMEDFRFCTNHKNGCGSGQVPKTKYSLSSKSFFSLFRKKIVIFFP